jgi:hypothetical protein
MLLVAPIAQLDRASDYRLVNAISPPTSRTTVGRLFDVRDKGRHVILKSRRPLEEWVFEVEVDAGQWKLLSRFFPKWKHPNSARTKFLRTWLGGIYQTAELSNPKTLIGRAAELEIRTSFNSDQLMSEWIYSVKPTTCL